MTTRRKLFAWLGAGVGAAALPASTLQAQKSLDDMMIRTRMLAAMKLADPPLFVPDLPEGAVIVTPKRK